MSKIMTGVALVALMAGAPSLSIAQDQAQDPLQPQTEMQAAPAPAEETLPETAPADDMAAPATTGSIQSNDVVAKPAAEQPAPMTADSGEKFFNEQDSGTILASELIGKTVYDTADESLGDVNDIIWSEEGQVEGVVVGVGGFLGIGEKDVAVNYDAITVTTDEDGNKKLVLDASADELAAAPGFVTQQQKLADARAQQQQPIEGTGMTSTPVAPEPAPAQ